jgi:flavin reductase (DIM6/NTAB) family NADH-FMN oxidoreductase RutF
MVATATSAPPLTTPSAQTYLMAAPAVDAAAFRQALSRLAAGVSIITTIGRDGQKIGLTATAVTSLSAEPPLILVCIGNWSQAIAPLEAGAPFIVQLLRAEQLHLAHHFATSQADKFASVAHSVGASSCPRLTDALAWIECTPNQLYPGGDHVIVVGQVVNILLGAEEQPPLVYFGRQFHTLRGPPSIDGG